MSDSLEKDDYILDIYKKKLSKFEIDELCDLNIKKIYYYKKDKEIDFENLFYSPSKLKYMFDHEYRYITSRDEHINYRYKFEDILGKGAYGDVIRCIDYKDFINVAIKINKNASYYYESYINELKILKLVKNSEYCINYIDEFKFRGHNCIVMKLYSSNLLGTKFKNFNLEGKIIVLKNVLKALDYLQSKYIIHGDLKPDNILFKNNIETDYSCVLGDFGLSKIKHDEKVNYRCNIQTIWYRSPEIFFKIPFNESIDMWSYGILFYELLFNINLIRTKKDEDLLLNIVYLIDVPEEKYILSDYRILNYFSSYKNKWVLNKNTTHDNKIMLPNASKKLKIDAIFNLNKYNYHICKIILFIVRKCLNYDSKLRYTPNELLNFININFKKMFQ